MATATGFYGFIVSPEQISNNTFSVTNQEDPATRNLNRAMQLVDQTLESHFKGEDMEMGRFYNPFTKVRLSERGSVWMYGASIEAVNAILKGLKTQNENGNTALYDKHYSRYTALLNQLYNNAAYYLGTFNLVSFTQTKEWTVYAVDRVNEKGKANVTGVLNVYDDQMWLIREFIEAYKLTGQKSYLEHAEYLTAYVLDGWDSGRDATGNEIGGIPWGPGYVTKHACSNGPMISPLVWLHELYKGKSDKIEYRYIDAKDKKTRKTKQEKKSDYYLSFAQKIYDWQKRHLLTAQGVYADMMGGCQPDCKIRYETVKGVKYRASTVLTDPVGTAYSYNSGTMLSGGADLYRATKNKAYIADISKLSDASFQHFAKLGTTVSDLYSFTTKGFNNWFNGVLMRGYMDVLPIHESASSYLEAFQKNLDYSYDNHLNQGYLPTNLLAGWNEDSEKNNVEAMFMFAYAAQYAVLSQFELER
ncbi:hydrolase [Sphingobacterium olei]|uniref:Hydrolase n=2 Tax=Sphingobacterium olei TaxID=2571155 RepID=A0A4U0P2Y9_9SPHI|nr:hydrolase [Sphingobacterium olei]